MSVFSCINMGSYSNFRRFFEAFVTQRFTQTKVSNVHYCCLCSMVSTNFCKKKKKCLSCFFLVLFSMKAFSILPSWIMQTDHALYTSCHRNMVFPYPLTCTVFIQSTEGFQPMGRSFQFVRLHEHRCLVFYASFYIWIESQLCFFKTSWSWSLWPLTSAVMVQSL